MLFEKRFWPGLADGSVTVTFRWWQRRQAIPGGRYRTPGGMIDVDAVDTVEQETISLADARRAGYASVQALVADLRPRPGTMLYRIEFHAAGVPDARDELAATAHLSPDDLALLDQRLARLDTASSHGPWTRATLELIAEHPATRAGDLADLVDRERLPFKVDVRKLKNLGLTLSLRVGYELSPRGRAYLDARPR